MKRILGASAEGPPFFQRHRMYHKHSPLVGPNAWSSVAPGLFADFTWPSWRVYWWHRADCRYEIHTRPVPNRSRGRIKGDSLLCPLLFTSAFVLLDSEADRFAHVTSLQFHKKRYTIRTDSRRKRVRILAPLKMAPTPTPFQLEIKGSGFAISGQSTLRPREPLGSE